MGLFTRNPKKADQQELYSETPVVPIDTIHRGLEYIIELVKLIRPFPYNNFRQADLKFKALFYQLQHNKTALFSLRKAILSQFLNSSFIPALTESGMVGSRGFVQEFSTKLKHKLLPSLLQPDDFLYVINHVFYKHHDHIWVKKIEKELWVNFFTILGVQVGINDKRILQQLNISLQILSHRTVAMGLEKEVVNSLEKIDFGTYPFLLLDKAVQNYLQIGDFELHEERVSEAVYKIVAAVGGCKKVIERISENRR